MSDFLSCVKQTNNWQEYYDTYKQAYKYLLEAKWAFGSAAFANQLHHTAIPDVSGTIAGTLNWTVYSQPSAHSLDAFLSVFRDLLQIEPHRIRNNRYLFFVTEGEPLSREDIKKVFGDIGNLVDFWCGSLDEALQVPEPLALVQGLDALLGAGNLLVDFLASHPLSPEKNTVEFLQSVRAISLDRLPVKVSVAPQAVQQLLVESFFILIANKLNISPEVTVDVVGEHAGLAAYVAANRARESMWKKETVAYCELILKRCPPRVVEYVVEPGDMLSRIVRRHFETSFDRLWPLIRALNPDISNPNRIMVGQKINLPLL